jgi:hypothetical protein
VDCKMTAHRLWGWILALILFGASIVAAYWVGFLLGWLTGASLSPVVSSVAPLVFGLLAVIGVSASVRGNFTHRIEISRGIFLALMVSTFCYACFTGVTWGNRSRMDPYPPLDVLIGESWQNVDDETAARLHAFRWKAQRAQIPHQEFEEFIVGVIKPIIDRKKPDEAKNIAAALQEMNAVLTSKNP